MYHRYCMQDIRVSSDVDIDLDPPSGFLEVEHEDDLHPEKCRRWSEWGSWSACSATCASSYKVRLAVLSTLASFSVRAKAVGG